MSIASVFIYYRARPDRAARLQALIPEVLSVVAITCAVSGRWMRRRDDPSTLLEIYESVEDPERLRSVSDDAFRRVGGPECLVEGGTRHVEIFVGLD